MKAPSWFERTFTFGLSAAMLPFYLERLEGTIARVRHKVATLSDDALAWQPAGKWCIKQHIGHLAEVDGVGLKRLHEMTTGVSPLSPAVFEPRGNYQHMPIQEVLTFFSDMRTRNLQAYRALTDAELTRASLHPRLQVLMTPVDLAWFDAEHDDHHLVAIQETIAAFTKR